MLAGDLYQLMVSGIEHDGQHRGVRLTQVFHIDGALFPKTGAVNRYRFCIGNQTAITAFGDSKTMNGRAGSGRDYLIEIGGRGIDMHRGVFWEFLGRFAWGGMFC